MKRKNGKHLTFDDRNKIESSIHKGKTISQIAKKLEKSFGTVKNEIVTHRKIAPALNMYGSSCSNFKFCKSRTCKNGGEICSSYDEFKCARRDKSPGACNGCDNWQSCHYDKYRYDAQIAQNEYKDTLSTSREGINVTEDELDHIGTTVGPLLKRGQSPYMIITNHPELNISVKTLYNYIGGNYLKDYEIISLDLREKVRRKPIKNKNPLKKRTDRKFIIGHKFEDFEKFMNNNPEAIAIQMDTVYNSERGPIIQTFKIVQTGLLLGVLHNNKTSDNMVKGVDYLEQIIEPLCKNRTVALLTDRGGEFVQRERLEKREDGSQRFHVFYCDPMCSYQKGSLENNHEELRYILPKEKDLSALGLVSQDSLNLVLSNVNSAPKLKLSGKSALEMTDFIFPELSENLSKYGINQIPKDLVNLTPSLLKSK